MVVIASNFVVGCGGDSKWKPYVGKWTDETKATRQMEIKANGGESFILTIHKKSFFGPGIESNDFIAKPSGEILAVSIAGFAEVPIIYDKKTDTISFDNTKYRRQTPDDAKKLEEIRKNK